MANQLADSISPYLQQHAANPVDWHVWGDDALEEARRRDVPLFVSVGYAACHWCHVMAHESFEDEEVARLVNAVTVPVKVDREERPDVDAVYMEATQAMTGQGGWPMSVFATPDGKPFFAGTYFPREHFVRLVEAVDTAWRERREEVVAQGNAVVEACAAAGPSLAEVTVACPIGGPCPPVSPVDAATLDAAAAAIRGARDPRNGGFGGAPKFPTQPALAFLLDHHGRSGDPESLDVVRHAAEGMARGGIHDQLGGGFARYSVDAEWTVPHFEKMLYDNALLLDTYAALDEVDPNPLWRRVCDETVGFLNRELRTPEGGFAAALDADTEGVEGATYVWTPGQLVEVLGESDGAWAADVFGVTEAGSFEHGTSVLRLRQEPQDIGRLDGVRRRLLAARDGRPQPGRDDKVVAAWNGLVILGLCRYAKRRGGDGGPRQDGSKASAELDAAVAAGRLLADVHLVDGRLRRVSRDGVVGEAAGLLEDYGAVAGAFLALHESTGDKGWLERARRLLKTVVDEFGDAEGGLHDTARDAQVLVSRPSEPTDGPTPSGWALAARAMVAFDRRVGDEVFGDTAWRAVARARPVIAAHPRFAAGLAAAAEAMLVSGEPG